MVNDDNFDNMEHTGFWARVGATVIDGVLIALITFPMLAIIYGEEYFDTDGPFVYGVADFLIGWVAPTVAAITFWVYKGATPGKMVIHAKIVDADTGKPPTVGQCLGRYACYFISGLPLGLGFLWVAFDKKKQGWHDKLANTVVIKPINPTAKVRFSFPENKDTRDEHSD